MGKKGGRKIRLTYSQSTVLRELAEGKTLVMNYLGDGGAYQIWDKGWTYPISATTFWSLLKRDLIAMTGKKPWMSFYTLSEKGCVVAHTLED
jgi:hypothetical protein